MTNTPHQISSTCSCEFCAALGLARSDGKPPPRENAVYDMYHIRIKQPVLLVSSSPHGILICWLSYLGRLVSQWRRRPRAESQAKQRLRRRRECTMSKKGPRVSTYVTSRGIPSTFCSVLTGQFTPLNSRPLICDGSLHHVFTISHSPVSFLPASVLHVSFSTLRCRRRCQSPCLKTGKPLAGLVGI